jgi:hypothetical protein
MGEGVDVGRVPRAVRGQWTLENVDYVGVLLGAKFKLRKFLEPVTTEEEVRRSDWFCSP